MVLYPKYAHNLDSRIAQKKHTVDENQHKNTFLKKFRSHIAFDSNAQEIYINKIVTELEHISLFLYHYKAFFKL